jgi:hypothetical protein
MEKSQRTAASYGRKSRATMKLVESLPAELQAALPSTREIEAELL